MWYAIEGHDGPDVLAKRLAARADEGEHHLPALAREVELPRLRKLVQLRKGG